MTINFKPQVMIGAAGLQSGAVPVESSASCKVGIDIGSTTIKVVVLDSNEKLVYKKYARHFSDIPTALVTNLTELRNVLVSLNGAAALDGPVEDMISRKFGARICSHANASGGRIYVGVRDDICSTLKSVLTDS